MVVFPCTGITVTIAIGVVAILIGLSGVLTSDRPTLVRIHYRAPASPPNERANPRLLLTFAWWSGCRYREGVFLAGDSWLKVDIYHTGTCCSVNERRESC
jgi:hypothetical protein